MQLNLSEEDAMQLKLYEKYRVILHPVDADHDEDIIVGERIVSNISAVEFGGRVAEHEATLLPELVDRDEQGPAYDIEPASEDGGS